MKRLLRMLRALAPLAALSACQPGDGAETDQVTQALTRADDFYVVAHMTNTRRSVQWAVGQGANALEMDLRFNDDGTPKEFRHGSVCDCTCATSHGSDDVCRVLRDDSFNTCEGSAEAREMMAEIVSVRDSIALLFIDSKLDESDPVSRQESAGRNVIRMIRDDLFAKGYRGKVVVGVAKPDAFQYLAAAAAAVRDEPAIRERVVFAFDENGPSSTNAATTISLETRFLWTGRAYGTGVSRCAPGNYKEAIRTADQNEDRYVQGLTYVWTIDSEASMEDYLVHSRPRAIITNNPSRLKRVALRMGRKLAVPGSPLTDVVSNDVLGPVNHECKCNYHKGGCSIAQPAPEGRACKCRYIWATWTCRGDTTSCRNPNSEKCRRPDGSKESCEEGGGDCGGYR